MIDRFRDAPVLVTGGLGFIGSNLVLRLLEAGARVTVLDLDPATRQGDIRNLTGVIDQVTIREVDLTSMDSWDELLADQEFVFHLAAQVSHSKSMASPLHDLDVNARAVLIMLEAARKRTWPPTFVFTSTRQVYGRAEKLPVDESHVRCPTDVNGINKSAAEDYFRIYRDNYGVPSTTLRLTNTYGPRMDLRNAGRGVLNVFLKRALLGEKLQLFGDGLMQRDVLFVDDVTSALLQAALIDDPGPFNLGADSPLTLRQFVESLQAILPVTWEFVPFPDQLRLIDVGDSACDYSKFHTATGWAPHVGLCEGLKRTVEYFQRRIARQGRQWLTGGSP